MNTKLTLSIDEKVIIRAKKYAKKKKRGLSQIIEDYLKSVSSDEKQEQDVMDLPPVTKALGGILKGKEALNFKDEIAGYMLDKHK